jgi:polyhydroxyalkanoate synthesis repressor PhaR
MDGADAAASPAPVIIKKYANRRLYNTAKSSYVTLDHLAAMVREGTDFVVYDAKSGEDITRSVLAQIIFEEEAKGASMLPASFLRQLIRLYGDALQSVVPSYLESAMATFHSNQEKMRDQMRAAFGANPAFSTLEAMTRANMEIYQNALRMFSPATAAKAMSEAAQPRERASEDDIEALKGRLKEMETQLDRLARKG